MDEYNADMNQEEITSTVKNILMKEIIEEYLRMGREFWSEEFREKMNQIIKNHNSFHVLKIINLYFDMLIETGKWNYIMRCPNCGADFPIMFDKKWIESIQEHVYEFRWIRDHCMQCGKVPDHLDLPVELEKKRNEKLIMNN